MAKIASQEKRELAISIYEAGGHSQASVAEMVGVHLVTFQRWLAAKRDEGRVAPRPRGHNPASFSGENLAALDAYVEAHVDATLEDLREVFASQVACSHVTIHNTLKRLGWAYKKSGYVRMSETDPISRPVARHG